MLVKQTWRVLPLLITSGQAHMAVDRWLLTQVSQGRHPPTLRFYQWQPAAISLGYHQRTYPDWSACQWQGQPLEVVRRPTGGRAVLHQGDLTYAVVAPVESAQRVQAYQLICQFLIAGWRSLGVELQFGSMHQSNHDNPNCFAAATTADLVLPTGHKLIGSAQAWRGQTVLQHGSIRLNPDPELGYQVFGRRQGSFDPFVPPLADPPRPASVVAALLNAAQQCFETELELQPLTPAEWQDILQLIHD